MGVWRSALLHEFPGPTLGNLHAPEGSLEVQRGPILSTAEGPSPRSFLVRPGDWLAYRYQGGFEDVIGVDISVTVEMPVQAFAPAIPLVTLGPQATLFLGLVGGVDPPRPSVGRGEVRLRIGNQEIAFDQVRVPQLVPRGRKFTLRARWHTSGQAQLWVRGRLSAYEPALAAGSRFAVPVVALGRPGSNPATAGSRAAQIFASHLYIKLLRERDALQQVGRFLDLGEVTATYEPPPEACITAARQAQQRMLSHARAFMAGIHQQLTTSWRHGQPGSPFAIRATEAHEAATEAFQAFFRFLQTSGTEQRDLYLERMGSFLEVLAETDSAGFRGLMETLEGERTSVDGSCRAALEQSLDLEREPLPAILDLLRETSERARRLGEAPDG